MRQIKDGDQEVAAEQEQVLAIDPNVVGLPVLEIEHVDIAVKAASGFGVFDSFIKGLLGQTG